MHWDLQAVVPAKKKPEIAVIFLHSSLTAENWAINSGLTAPLSHLAPVIRTIITSAIIIVSCYADDITLVPHLLKCKKLAEAVFSSIPGVTKSVKFI